MGRKPDRRLYHAAKPHYINCRRWIHIQARQRPLVRLSIRFIRLYPLVLIMICNFIITLPDGPGFECVKLVTYQFMEMLTIGEMVTHWRSLGATEIKIEFVA